MLLEDKMRSRPQQPLHTKEWRISFENEIKEVETTLDSFNGILTGGKKEWFGKWGYWYLEKGPCSVTSAVGTEISVELISQ